MLWRLVLSHARCPAPTQPGVGSWCPMHFVSGAQHSLLRPTTLFFTLPLTITCPSSSGPFPQSQPGHLCGNEVGFLLAHFRNLHPLNTWVPSCHFCTCSPVVLGLVARPHSGLWFGVTLWACNSSPTSTDLWIAYSQLLKGRLLIGEKSLWGNRAWETPCSQLPYWPFFRAE